MDYGRIMDSRMIEDGLLCEGFDGDVTLVEVDPVHGSERSVSEESGEMDLIGVEVLAIGG
jgi:hypothetical protein